MGHVVSGDSLMVREESTIRHWGARALAGTAKGEGEIEPTLAALYSLAPGQVLGHRPLALGAVSELRRLRALQDAHAARGAKVVRVVSSVGDRDARIEWRYADGTRLGIWFRGWASGLRAGGAVEAELDLRTRSALLAAGL